MKKIQTPTNRTLPLAWGPLLALLLGGLMLDSVLQGCTTTPPAQAPEVEAAPPGEETDAARLDIRQARRLLDELALSAIQATGHIDFRPYQVAEGGKIGLTEAATQGVAPDLARRFSNAVDAVNTNPLAAKLLGKGIEEARKYCSAHACDDDAYRIELARLETPPDEGDDVVVRASLSGKPEAICTAVDQFNLLYRIKGTPEASCNASGGPQFLYLTVGREAASALTSLDCVPDTSVPPTAAEDRCCYHRFPDRHKSYGIFVSTGDGLDCTAADQ